PAAGRGEAGHGIAALVLAAPGGLPQRLQPRARRAQRRLPPGHGLPLRRGAGAAVDLRPVRAVCDLLVELPARPRLGDLPAAVLRRLVPPPGAPPAGREGRGCRPRAPIPATAPAGHAVAGRALPGQAELPGPRAGGRARAARGGARARAPRRPGRLRAGPPPLAGGPAWVR